jgi:uroporphyrin-III C-methyltransferase
MLKKIHPKLTIAGAGPGDPDLITAKAIRALGKADVILYDSLVNVDLLKYASAHAKKIFVGKRNGQPSFKQETINNLIVDMAFIYGHVVRLKGGDPFIFGRGYEEIAHAQSFNIETEVIPGISSSTGVLASHSIPLTHRGLSESFWVVTGTTRTGEISGDIALAAQSTATVVILMGLHKLNEIVEVYKSIGKRDIPVAIIQNGSLPNEKSIVGTIHTIELIADYHRIVSPAIIVIGEVVKLHHKYIERKIINEYLVN